MILLLLLLFLLLLLDRGSAEPQRFLGFAPVKNLVALKKESLVAGPGFLPKTEGVLWVLLKTSKQTG